MQNKWMRNIFNINSGFSLLEVLLGITVFMIGMLGVTALNISSLKSNTFSGNMSEAVIIAGDKLEELMAKPFDDPDLSDADADGTDEDLLPAISAEIFGDGIDDDGGNFGLNDTGCPQSPPVIADADHCELNVGRKDINEIGIYNVYWNVAVDEPLPEKNKKVNVIVEWDIKDVKRSISMSTIILDHD